MHWDAVACSEVKYSAVQCSAVQYSTVQCSALQCSGMQWRKVRCSALRCSTVQCSAVQCSTVQCSAVQCSAVQCSAVQLRAVQCSAVQWCNALHLVVQSSSSVCPSSSDEGRGVRQANSLAVLIETSRKKLISQLPLLFQRNLYRPYFSGPVSIQHLAVSNECKVLAGEQDF